LAVGLEGPGFVEDRSEDSEHCVRRLNLERLSVLDDRAVVDRLREARWVVVNIHHADLDADAAAERPLQTAVGARQSQLVLRAGLAVCGPVGRHQHVRVGELFQQREVTLSHTHTHTLHLLQLLQPHPGAVGSVIAYSRCCSLLLIINARLDCYQWRFHPGAGGGGAQAPKSRLARQI